MSNKLIQTTATRCQRFLQIYHHSVKKHHSAPSMDGHNIIDILYYTKYGCWLINWLAGSMYVLPIDQWNQFRFDEGSGEGGGGKSFFGSRGACPCEIFISEAEPKCCIFRSFEVTCIAFWQKGQGGGVICTPLPPGTDATAQP